MGDTPEFAQGLTTSPDQGKVAHVSNPTPSEDELLTTQQVADLTGWSVTSINRWALRGDLPTAQKHPTRTGPRYFRRGDVQQRLLERASA